MWPPSGVMSQPRLCFEERHVKTQHAGVTITVATLVDSASVLNFGSFGVNSELRALPTAASLAAQKRAHPNM